MDFQTVIEKRRSVRNYDASKQVTKEQVEQIVKAAMEAPSWKNSQTARYYCILDPSKKEVFSKECLPERNANNSKNAALVVTTFVANQSGFDTLTGVPTNECGNGWGYYDLGLHNEIFLLKAAEMGLDTLVMGIRDADKIREQLQIPKTEIIVSVIALGYASSEGKKPARKQLEEVLIIF